MTGLSSYLNPPGALRPLANGLGISSRPRGQLADTLRHPPVRQSALAGLAQCLAPQNQTYVLSVEMDIETKHALDRGETISMWRCS